MDTAGCNIKYSLEEESGFKRQFTNHGLLSLGVNEASLPRMTQGFSIAVSKPGATEPSKSRWALRAVSIVVVISILNLFVFTRNINNSAPAASFQSLEREQHVAVLGTLPSQAPVSNSSTNVTLPAHYPRISNSTSIYMNGSQAINSAIQTETSAEVSNDSEMANSTTLIDSFNASAPESDKLIIMGKFNAGSRSNSDFTSDLERRWAEAIQQATSLIYRSSGKETLEYWLSQPPPRIYIYDELPNDFTDMETVSTCVDRKFLGKNYSDWPNCPWRPTKPCEDGDRGRSQKQKMFMAARYNYNTDVAYIDKFLQYPFVTTDPKEADMFIVPYPHKSHCLCNKDFKLHSAKCSVSFSDIKSKVLDQLTHFHKKDSNYRRRHLFFLGADYEQGLRPLRQAVYGSMTLSLGPAVPCKEKKSSCGHFSVPYLTTDPDYQPSVLAGIDDETWATREREYSVGAALSAPKALALRGEFLKQWKDWIGESIQGKPNKIFNMGQQRSGKKSRFFMNLYRNSTLCVIVSPS